MSRKPKRPEIAGLRPEGPFGGKVCNYCYDLPDRRPRGAYLDPRNKEVRSGCPGCGKDWSDEGEQQNVELQIEDAAWQLLGDQQARESMGVNTFEQAKRVVADLVRGPNQGPEGKRTAKYCNYCCGLAHRRPVDKKCPGCKERFAPEVLSIPTGLQSTLASLETLG